MRNDVLEAVKATIPSPSAIPARIRASKWNSTDNALLALGLLASGLLGLALTTWRLADSGFANTYYASAAKSMASNAHAWFFVAHDPLGYLSIDKPPLGFWLQALFVRVLGFSPLALLLPQALLGAFAAPIFGVFMRRVATSGVAVAAAFALALTPIWIVSSRSDVVDIPLAFVLILAAGALINAIALSRRATASATANVAPWWRTREALWIVVAFGLIGVAFNIKMLEAYLAVPAFILTYLLCSRLPACQRLMLLALALGVMLVVSLAWIEVVDLTPASARPYVDNTATNSELDLAFGYNGLRRLFGMSSKGFNFTPPGPSGVFGAPSLLRLLQPPLGSQVSWLMPLAIVGLIVAWPFGGPSQWLGRLSGASRQTPGAERREHLRRAGYILFTLWMITGWIFFSIGRAFGGYYIVAVVPAFCALTAMGLAPLWQSSTRSSWRSAFSALAVVETIIEQVYLMTSSAPGWVKPGLIVFLTLAALMALLLALWRAAPSQMNALSAELTQRIDGLGPQFATANRGLERATRRAFGGAMLGALLTVAAFIAPALWTLASLTPGNAQSHPTPGPEYASLRVPTLKVDKGLVAYLEAHRNGAAYLVASQSGNPAEAIYLLTSQPTMELGGFFGHAPILTPQTLRPLIAANRVRYIVLPSTEVTQKERQQLYAEIHHGKKGTFGGPAFHHGDPLYDWIATTCVPVPPKYWSAASNASRTLGKGELYDCSALVKTTAKG